MLTSTIKTIPVRVEIIARVGDKEIVLREEDVPVRCLDEWERQPDGRPYELDAWKGLNPFVQAAYIRAQGELEQAIVEAEQQHTR
jgi:hypothetical protein